MNYPNFFDEVPTITLNDSLASLLGAFSDGNITYSYLDVVKLAGHSCPTVAGAYLMCLKGLEAIYKDKTAVRGEIKIEFGDSVSDGVTGVVANVMSMITGAAAEGGFKGIGGNFVRHSLISFNNQEVKSSVRITRVDTNESVDLFYNPQALGGNPDIKVKLGKIASGAGDESDKEEFQKMWQAGVQKILVEQRDNQELLRIEIK